MAKVVAGCNMSLDGFINDSNGDVMRLYPNFAEVHETDLMKDSIRDTGAVVMGRNAYEMGQGDYTQYEFQVPIFVLTHQPPAQAAKTTPGPLKFNFVTDGVESAVRQAKAAAGDKDVTVIGGANTIQQLLNAGLIDELQVGIVPILLGSGLRFFDHLESRDTKLKKSKSQELFGVNYIWYTVIK